MFDSLQPHGVNSPGQNTGVCSYSLLWDIFPTQWVLIQNSEKILVKKKKVGLLLLDYKTYYKTIVKTVWYLCSKNIETNKREI